MKLNQILSDSELINLKSQKDQSQNKLMIQRKVKKYEYTRTDIDYRDE